MTDAADRRTDQHEPLAWEAMYEKASGIIADLRAQLSQAEGTIKAQAAEIDALRPADIARDQGSVAVHAMRMMRGGYSYDAQAGIWWKDDDKPGIVKELEGTIRQLQVLQAEDEARIRNRELSCDEWMARCQVLEAELTTLRAQGAALAQERDRLRDDRNCEKRMRKDSDDRATVLEEGQAALVALVAQWRDEAVLSRERADRTNNSRMMYVNHGMASSLNVCAQQLADALRAPRQEQQ